MRRMATESTSGRMDLFIKASGKWVRLRVTGSRDIKMATSTMGNGKTIRSRVLESISGLPQSRERRGSSRMERS